MCCVSGSERWEQRRNQIHLRERPVSSRGVYEKLRKPWCFTSSWRGAYASSRRQVALRKLIDRSLLYWMQQFSKPRDSIHFGKVFLLWQRNKVLWDGVKKMIRFPFFHTLSALHCLLHCCRAKSESDLLPGLAEVKQLNSFYVFRSNLSFVFEKPPGEMSLHCWPLLNMKNRSACRLDYANTKSVPRIGDNVNLHNFLNVCIFCLDDE